MLNDNDTVSYVPQVFEGINQLDIVALVKTNTRLVKYIEHIDKLRAYLSRKPYALTLTARKSGRAS